MAEREGFELYCQVIVYRLPALLLSRKRMRLLPLHDMPKYLQVINCYRLNGLYCLKQNDIFLFQAL